MPNQNAGDGAVYNVLMTGRTTEQEHIVALFLVGLVTLAFRSLNSFMRRFVQMPRGLFHLATSAVVVDYKNH